MGTRLDQFPRDKSEDVRRYDLFDGGPINQETVLAAAEKLKATSGNKKRSRTGNYDGPEPPKFQSLTLARASELEQPADDSHFLRMFGQSDRTVADDGSLEGGIPQILMLMNGSVQELIASDTAIAFKAAAGKPTTQEQAMSLYVSFLGRTPTPRELTTIQRAFQNGMNLSELTWMLFNSREFIFVQSNSASSAQ